MIRVVTDSSSDLPGEVADAHDISIVPLTIRFAQDEFVDRRDLSIPDFWQRLVSSEVLPETAAPGVGLFKDRYQHLISEGATGILVMTLSEALSGTYQSAVIAAEQTESDVPIRVIDSRSVGMGLGLPVLEVADQAAQGVSLDELLDAAERSIASTTVLAALDTLDYLRMGGRIGSAQAFFGSLLNIKPLITLVDGRVEPLGRVRTRSKALMALEQRVAALERRISSAAVFHGNADDVDEFRERIQRHVGIPIVTTMLGPVVGTHTGPGTIGIAYRLD